MTGRPQPIGPVMGARAARATRAAERWAEQGGDLRGVPLAVVVCAVVALAEELHRDLDAAEVDRACSSTVAAHVDAEEQRQAEEALAGARETERLAYLARTAERLRRTREPT
jgi:hypothetical protein